MLTKEKEININLQERLHILRRIKKVVKKENVKIEEILEAIEEEEADIKEMLYQKPPYMED